MGTTPAGQSLGVTFEAIQTLPIQGLRSACHCIASPGKVLWEPHLLGSGTSTVQALIEGVADRAPALRPGLDMERRRLALKVSSITRYPMLGGGEMEIRMKTFFSL